MFQPVLWTAIVLVVILSIGAAILCDWANMTLTELFQFVYADLWQDRCKQCGWRWIWCFLRSKRVPTTSNQRSMYVGNFVARMFTGVVCDEDSPSQTIGDFWMIQHWRFKERVVVWYKHPTLQGPQCFDVACDHTDCGLPISLKKVGRWQTPTPPNNSASFGSSRILKPNGYLSAWPDIPLHPQLQPDTWPTLRKELVNFARATSNTNGSVLITVHTTVRPAGQTLHFHATTKTSRILETFSLWQGKGVRVDDIVNDTYVPLTHKWICAGTIDVPVKNKSFVKKN